MGVAAMKTKDALVVYPKLDTSALRVESFFEEINFRVTKKRHDSVLEMDVAIAHVLVLVGDDYLSYNQKALYNLLGWAIVNNTAILGLGDVNSLILEYMHIDHMKVSDHMIPTTQLHNILTMDGEELFIPSRHTTLPLLDEFAYYDRKKEYNSLIEVAALAPILELPQPIKVWAEMVVIKSIRYFGIYGSPEFFTEHVSNADDNDMSEATISFIQSILKDLML